MPRTFTDEQVQGLVVPSGRTFTDEQVSALEAAEQEKKGWRDRLGVPTDYPGPQGDAALSPEELSTMSFQSPNAAVGLRSFARNIAINPFGLIPGTGESVYEEAVGGLSAAGDYARERIMEIFSGEKARPFGEIYEENKAEIEDLYEAGKQAFPGSSNAGEAAAMVVGLLKGDPVTKTAIGGITPLVAKASPILRRAAVKGSEKTLAKRYGLSTAQEGKEKIIQHLIETDDALQQMILDLQNQGRKAVIRRNPAQTEARLREFYREAHAGDMGKSNEDLMRLLPEEIKIALGNKIAMQEKVPPTMAQALRDFLRGTEGKEPSSYFDPRKQGIPEVMGKAGGAILGGLAGKPAYALGPWVGVPVQGAAINYGARLGGAGGGRINKYANPVAGLAFEWAAKFAPILEDAFSRGGAPSLNATHHVLMQTQPEYRQFYMEEEKKRGAEK